MRYAIQQAVISNRQVLTLLGIINVGIAVSLVILILGPPRLQVGVILLILIMIALAPLVTRPFDIFEASSVFIIGYILYSFGILFSFSVFGRTTFLLGMEITSDELDLLLKSAGLYTLGIIGFHLGYSTKLGSALALKFPKFNGATLNYSRLAAIAWIYLFIGASLLTLLIVKVGGFQRFVSIQYGERHLIARGLGYLMIGIYMINIALFLLYCCLRRASFRGRRLLLFIYWVVVASYGFALFLTGRRAPLSFLIISVLVFHHYTVKSIPIKKLLTMGAVAIFLLFCWGRIRGIGTAPLSQILAYTKENVSWEWFDPAVTEFGAAPVILLWVLKHHPVQDYWLGMSYINAFLNQVPQAFFPNRPIAPGEWFVKTFFPVYYEKGGGLGFSYLAEAYLNFGIAGPLVISCIAGILCAALYSYRHSKITEVPSEILYAISVPWILWSFRSDFASLLRGGVIGYFIPTIIALGFAVRWKMRR